MISIPRWLSPMTVSLFGESKTTRKISKHRGERGTSFQRWRRRRFQWLTKNATDFAWIKVFEIPIFPAEFIISDGEISFSYWLVWWYWWVNHPCLTGTFQFLCLTPHLSWFVTASRPIISILCTQKRSIFLLLQCPSCWKIYTSPGCWNSISTTGIGH